MANKKEKLIIYQAMVRLFGNRNTQRIPNGTIEQNGCGKMSDFSDSALRSIKKLGCDYIWYTGLLQQASQTDYSKYGIPSQNRHVLKGVAGSPYAITDYYSVSCDLADDPDKRMDEFDALVKRTHDAGLRMIIDFVPNHVARQYHSVTKPKNLHDLGEEEHTEMGFDTRNCFYYMPGQQFSPQFDLGQGDDAYIENPAKATGNDVFHASPSVNDWYETVKLNYGVDYCGGHRCCFDPIPATWIAMRDIVMYWAKKGVDGFRCDMAFMVPVEFWHWLIPQVKAYRIGIIFIAEIYDPGLYERYINYGYFDYLYDKVGLYDTLRAVVECRESASAVTRVWQGLEHVQSHMLNFLENHDEQRIASDFFAGDPIKARPAFVVSALMNTCPFMLYFGQELGERGMDEEGFSGRDGRTTIFDYWSLPLIQSWAGKDLAWTKYGLLKSVRNLRDYYERVFEIAHNDETISKGGFYDLTYANYDNPDYNIHRMFAFLRYNRKQTTLVVANFEGEDRDIKLRVPVEAWEFVGVKSGRRHVVNQLTGEWDFLNHDITQPMSIHLPAYDAVVLKIKGK